MENWYYVVGQDRKGPVSIEAIIDLIGDGTLGPDGYVWRNGLDGWKKIKELKEFSEAETNVRPLMMEQPILPTIQPTPKFDWNKIDNSKKIFSVRIGPDRGTETQEYGPFSLDSVKSLLSEDRINGKTLVFAPGMEQWIFIADTPLMQTQTETGQKIVPPTITAEERRKYTRRPFVARLLFHDNEGVYEGICRDISIGGMQVLVADFPMAKGDMIELNVHPDNSSLSFVAKGKIVRVLEGRQGFSVRFEGLSEAAQAGILKYIENDE